MMRRRYAFRSPLKRAAVACLDAAGSLAVPPFLKKPGETDWSNVLVMRLDHLGDVLAATGVPETIKRRHPRARVSFLTASWAAPLLENNPHIDERLTYDAPWFASGRYKRQGAGYGHTVKELKRRRFTTALSLRGDAREHALAFLAGIPERVGPGITGGAFLLTRETPVDPAAHESTRVMSLLGALGLDARNMRPQIYFSKDEEFAWRGMAERWGLSGDAFAGFTSETGDPEKNWPAGHAEAFAESFRRRFPETRLVWVGGAAKSGSPRAAADDADLRGKTSLRELCLVLKHARTFLGPDSGPAHLASALGVPTVFLYSLTNDLGRWKPLAPTAVVLRGRMDSIAPETALEALAGAASQTNQKEGRG